MSLAPGTRLGQYDLQSRLGGGGMGEVWKAYDPKLQRTVAIKVLKDQTEDAASRILAEARAASALNHPHICTLYDVGRRACHANRWLDRRRRNRGNTERHAPGAARGRAHR